MCFKKFVWEKKSFGLTGIRTLYLMLESQLLYQLGYRYYCGFNGMLLSIFFNLLQGAN